MSADISTYTDLITSEHADKPKFEAVIAASVQPFADGMALMASFSQLFDLDAAIGAQLDVVGLWVGRSRNIVLPLMGIYFAFDQNGVGFDQGIWFEAFDPVTNEFALPDGQYRTLLRAKIASNQWDGSIPGAYAAYNLLFNIWVVTPPTMLLDDEGNPILDEAGQPIFDEGTRTNVGSTILIQDGGDMTMMIALLGPLPDPLTLALLTGGYLSLKPVGVHITNYLIPTVPSAPYFGFDVETSAISGFDVGGWGQAL